MTTKRCGCGNDDVLPGYRVCAECKEAREIYPRIFEGDEPDKLPDDAEAADDVLNEDIEVITERIAEIVAERDALKAENARLKSLLTINFPYVSYKQIADILDGISVASWESYRAAAIGYTIGFLTRLHNALKAESDGE